MDIVLEGYSTKLTNIYKDKEYRGYYTIELSVGGVSFYSTAILVKEKIIEIFNISENEFNKLLNYK